MHYPKVLERVDSPEQIFHRRFSLGAPDANTTGHINRICSYFEFIKPFLFVRNLSPRQESNPRFSEHRAGAL